MMLPENTWRRVRSASDPATGERTVLLSAVFAGVRLWCEKHWSKPDMVSGERVLVHERFTWLNPEDVRHPGRWQSSAEGALREMEQSKLNEEQMAQLDPEQIP
jgi:hypothetical protein